MANDIIEQRTEARDAVHAYADRVLRKILHWGHADFRLSIPTTGRRQLLFILNPEGHDSVMLYAFRRRQDFERFSRAVQLVKFHELPVPQLIHEGWSWLERARSGYCFIVTEAPPGQPVSSALPDAELRADLARSLALMHNVRRPHWGRPGHYQKGSIKEGWHQKIRKILDEISAVRRLEALIGPLDNWFLRTLASMEEPETFHLCHTHLEPEDILYDKDSGRITFVDCSSLQFSRAPRDLAAVRHAFYREFADEWDKFLDDYFPHMPPAAREEYDHDRPFYEAYFYLRKVRHLRGNGKGPYPNVEKLIEVTGIKADKSGTADS